MTSVIPQPIPGHIVPGTTSPFIKVLKPWGWENIRINPGVITTRPYGPPVKKEPKAQPAPTPNQPQQAPAKIIGQPKQIGDEHAMGIIHALSRMAQRTSKITEALPSDRDWR